MSSTAPRQRVSAATKVAQLLRAAAEDPRASRAVTHVHQAQEILRRHPDALASAAPLAAALAAGGAVPDRPDVPIAALRLVEEVVCRVRIPQQDVAPVLQCCAALVVRCLMATLEDVAKRALRSLCAFFPVAARWVWTLPPNAPGSDAAVATWSSLQDAKLRAFSMLSMPNRGIQEAAVRFLHRLIVFQTPETTPQNAQSASSATGTILSTSVCVPGNTIVNATELQTESVAILQKLQELMTSPSFAGGPLFAHINCLVPLAQARPQLFELIAKPLIQVAAHPPTDWSPLVTASVMRTLRSVFIAFLRLSTISQDDTVLIEDTLQAMGVKIQDLPAFNKRRDATSSTKRLADNTPDAMDQASKRSRTGPSTHQQQTPGAMQSLAASGVNLAALAALAPQLPGLLTLLLAQAPPKPVLISIPDSLPRESQKERKELSKRVLKEIPLSVLTINAVVECIMGSLSRVSGARLAKAITNHAIENNITFDPETLAAIQDDGANVIDDTENDDVMAVGEETIKEEQPNDVEKEFYDYAADGDEDDEIARGVTDKSQKISTGDGIGADEDDEDDDLENAQGISHAGVPGISAAGDSKSIKGPHATDAETDGTMTTDTNVVKASEAKVAQSDVLDSIIGELESVEVTVEQQQQMALDTFKRILYSEPNVFNRTLYDTWAFTVCKLASGFLGIGKPVLREWVVENFDEDRWSLAKLWLLHIYTHEVKLKILTRKMKLNTKRGREEAAKKLPAILLEFDGDVNDESICKVTSNLSIKAESIAEQPAVKEEPKTSTKKTTRKRGASRSEEKESKMELDVVTKREPPEFSKNLELVVDYEKLQEERLFDYETELSLMKDKLKEGANKTDDEIAILCKDLPEPIISLTS